MSELNEKTYEELRKEIEDSCRAQIEDEIRKRKEIEEKYYQACDKIEILEEQVASARLTINDLAASNRNLIGCKMSFFQFMNNRRIYLKREQDLLNKGMEFWGEVFDPEYYAKNNPDIVEQVGNDADALLRYFVSLGIYQCHQGCKDFNVEKYLEYNQDIAGNTRMDKRDAYIHYIMYGKAENRRK